MKILFFVMQVAQETPPRWVFEKETIHVNDHYEFALVDKNKTTGETLFVRYHDLHDIHTELLAKQYLGYKDCMSEFNFPTDKDISSAKQRSLKRVPKLQAWLDRARYVGVLHEIITDV